MSDVHKRLAEMKSAWGCGEPVYSNVRWIECTCLFLSRWRYRLTASLYYSIKYWWQRHTRGYDDLDKWNAGWYIARKAVPVLTAWRNGRMIGTAMRRHMESRHGEIIELSDREMQYDGADSDALSEEEWKAVVDDIIFALQYVIDSDDCAHVDCSAETAAQLHKRHKRGLRLLGIYYTSLWD